MHIYLHKNDSICTNFGLFAQNEFYLHKTFATIFHTIIHPQTLNGQKLQNNHFYLIVQQITVRIIHKVQKIITIIMVAVATLGSHCSLQVLKGAKDEGLKTILVCEKKREKLYKRFPFIDELIIVDSFKEVLDQKCQSILEQNNAVLIPHGT